MRRPGGPRSVEALSLAIVCATALGLVAMTTIVYFRLAEELAARTRESIASRVTAVSSAVADVYSLAADEAMNLMVLMEQGDRPSRASIAEQLGTIQDGLIGCSAAWIAVGDEEPIAARGTSPAVVRGRAWWRAYLRDGERGPAGAGAAYASLGIRRNIGFVAPPFRGDTGIGTLLPLVVDRYSGTDRRATVFFELDLSAILDGLKSAPQGWSRVGTYPMELFFYDQAGVLIETTRNLPKVRTQPFRPEHARGADQPLGGTLLDYLRPGDRSIEASRRDERLGLVCVGRIPARLVMRDVSAVATQVLAVGALALGSVVALGLLLLQALRRARSFEKEQLVARFEALQAKVNPHFIFNALDSIVGVAAERDFDGVMRMLRALSSMLRASVRSAGDFVTVAEELDYVRAYLAIQEARYRDRFSWRIEAEDEALAALVCRFSVQPLVENCFTHGVHEGREGMSIAIAARARDGAVEVEVADDGPGCDEGTRRALAESFRGGRDLLGREGGLFNVHVRAKMAFGEGCGLELAEGGAGFRVRLRVPAPAKEG